MKDKHNVNGNSKFSLHFIKSQRHTPEAGCVFGMTVCRQRAKTSDSVSVFI